jgi:hypothetical protein
MKRTPIRDIRYFESVHPIGSGHPLPARLGALYPIERDADTAWLGERYARKLAEAGCCLPGFHHLYLVLTPRADSGEVSVSQLIIEPWFRYVSVGLSPQDWLSLNQKDRFRRLVTLTTAALRRLCGEHDLTPAPLADVEGQVLQRGSELELLHKRKETAAYVVQITYQIAPHGGPSLAFLDVREKKTGRVGKKVLTPLRWHDDLRCLMSTISISSGSIRLTPRSSFRASLATQHYPIPLEVSVEDVLAAGIPAEPHTGLRATKAEGT